ncbi:MAG: glycosyltransferase family 4 protein [Candidatus Moranbacteria bacterium]|nr:glycosyltransferase family 4 protein [Candidatus Moranbacteria bacterium]
MKVLFLNYEYPPLGGGAGNATAYILREYAQRSDMEVHLVTSSCDEYQETSLSKNVKIFFVPIGKKGGNLHHQSLWDILAYAWQGYRFADRLLAQEKYDVIHAFFSVPCGYMAMCLGKKYHVPYLVSLRGADVPGYSERFTFIYFFLRALIRRIWRKAAFVVANSSGLRTLALETNQTQEISVVQNGVNVDEFYPDPQREIDGYMRILCVSRLTPRKGIRYLIHAIKILLVKDTSRKLELWIAGEGDEMTALKNLAVELGIKDKVKFFGRVEHEKLVAYYQIADIFCLPSHNEGMSNTMLEALAAGMPIVATITGGTEELVTDGENGFFVKQQSADDLAEKLEKLMSDETMRVAFGKMSRRRAEAMSWQKVSGQYVDLYRAAQ